MKKGIIAVMATLALALVGLAYAAANTTTLSAPGSSGRPSLDTTTRGNVTTTMGRGIAECSYGIGFTCAQTTSTAFSVTATCGLSYVANSSPGAVTNYGGTMRIFVVNTGSNSTLVAYVNRTNTATACSNPAGEVIPAQTSKYIDCQPLAGETVHFQGLSGSAQGNFTVCTF